MKKLLLSIICLLATATLWAQTNFDFSAVAPSGQTLYYKINGDGTSVSITYPNPNFSIVSPYPPSDPYANEYEGAYFHYAEPAGNLDIPSSVTYSGNSYMVTSIGEYALLDCDGLTSINIPNSVTNIGNSAFSCCEYLTSVSIPNSITNIGDSAFYYCRRLTSITIPNSVTTIGDYAFYGCQNLTSITISNSVTTIGDYAFFFCIELTSVTISNSVTTIGDYAFGSCKKLTSVTIPNSVTTIGSMAFNSCAFLTAINVNSDNPNYKSINGVLYSKDGTTLIGYPMGKTGSSFTIPNSVTSIGRGAFSGCSGLTSVTIPNSVTSIGDGAFGSCKKLTSITIPNSVTSIGESAFNNCDKLTSVTIPNSVTSIGWGAFNSCAFLTAINVNSSNTKFQSINGVLYSKDGTTLICYPMGKTGSSFTIPNSVKTIGDCAFYDCQNLTSVTIPNSVTSIGNSAFAYSLRLTSVSIGNSVTSIGDGAFDCCYKLATITIPNSVTTIGSRAFARCSELTSVTIPNSVTSIGEEAFSACLGLTSVTIPNSVTTIGSMAFSGCRGLTSVTIPNSVTSIGWLAFYACTGLTAINVNSSNTKFKSINGVLYSKDGTTLICYPMGKTGSSFTIPNSVTSIGRWAFCDCPGLTSVTIPNSVTTIGNYAFCECPGLTSVTIPNSVTNIGKSAFYNCSGLTSVSIPNSVTTISRHAFHKCTALSYIICEAITPPKIGQTFYAYNSSKPYSLSSFSAYDKPLYVPCCSIEAYRNHPVWGNFTTILSIESTSHTVSASANDASMGSVSVSGSGTYNCGDTATLTAIPNEGYHFVKWSDENTDITRDVTVTQDSVFTAIFAPNPSTCTITIDVNDPSMGGVTGGGEYGVGETVTLIATPAEGYHFVKWSDENTDITRDVTVTQDSVFTAIFAPNTYTVNGEPNDAGKGSVTGGGTYNHGEPATLTATPAEGYCFIQWNDGNTENPRTITATQDSTFTAVFDFKRRTHTVSVCQGEAYSYKDSVFSTTSVGTVSKEVRFSNLADCDSVVTVNLTVTAKSSATGIMLKDTCFEMGKATQLKVESPVASATYRFYDSHHALLHTGTEYTTAPLSSEEVFYVTMQEPSKCESAEKSITVSECVTPTHLFQLHKTVDNASVCKNSIVTITTVIEKLTPALIHKIQIIEDFGFADLKLLTAELKIDGKTVPYTRDVAHNKLFFNMGELSGIGTYTLTITARAFPNLGPKTETTTIRWANYPTGITETASFNVVD